MTSVGSGALQIAEVKQRHASAQMSLPDLPVCQQTLLTVFLLLLDLVLKVDIFEMATTLNSTGATVSFKRRYNFTGSWYQWHYS